MPSGLKFAISRMSSFVSSSIESSLPPITPAARPTGVFSSAMTESSEVSVSVSPSKRLVLALVGAAHDGAAGDVAAVEAVRQRPVANIM